MRLYKKTEPWLSFRELNRYFMNPDSQIENLSAVSALQFANDLDCLIRLSQTNACIRGRFDVASVKTEPRTVNKSQPPLVVRFLHRCKGSGWHRLFSKQPDRSPLQESAVTICSWRFTDFDSAKQFRVRDLYTIRPVSLEYRSAQQDYHYDKQIVSAFQVVEANGNIKKLVIIDSIKNGRVKREKLIDGQRISRGNFQFEIRTHRLNRGLMKTFLFHRIHAYMNFEYDQSNRLRCKGPAVRKSREAAGAAADFFLRGQAIVSGGHPVAFGQPGL